MVCQYIKHEQKWKETNRKRKKEEVELIKY